MDNVYIGLGIMVVIYFLYFLIIINNKRRLNKYIKNSKETVLIRNRYKINFDKVNHKLVANLFAFTNSIIIGLTYAVVMVLNYNIILKLLIAFILFMFLIIVSYLNIGKYIKKKEER